MSGLKIIHTSDWHFGHGRVDTDDTISDIRKYLFPKLVDADILVIAGDIFDNSISINSKDAASVLAFFVDVFYKCYEHNVILRILLGTFSHDRNQIKSIERLYSRFNIPLDFRYIDTIDVEYIAKVDTSFLYLPDNLPYKTKHEVFEQVDKLLIGADISKVDYVINHGEFNHATYGYINDNAYDVSDFKDICKYLVLSGHIHNKSKRGNVLYAGSINRLAHNEESAKGFWYIEGTDTKFITNTSATQFITETYEGTDLDTLLKYHDELIASKFDPNRRGYLRLIIDDVHIRQAVRKYHDKQEFNVVLTFKINKKQSDQFDLNIKAERTEILVAPSEATISTIVSEHLIKTKATNLPLDTIKSIIFDHT